MKKTLLMICFLSLFFVNGCFIKEKDLGQMFFPISLGITYENNKYKIYLQVLNTSTISIVETEGSINESTFILIHEEDEDINKIFTKLGLKTLTFISAVKLRSIIINKSVFDDGPLEYSEICKYFINSPIFRSKVNIYVTEEKIEDFYSVKYNLVGTGIYSHASDKDPKLIKGFATPAYLLDSLKSYYENKRMYAFPLMKIREDIIEEGDKDGKLQSIKSYAYDGLCYTTYNFNEINCLNKEETLGYRYYKEIPFLNIEISHNNSPINIIIDKSNFKTKIEDNQFQITITNESYISLNQTNLSLKEIKQKLNEEIKKDIINTLSLAYYRNIDIYHLNDYAFRKNKNLKYNLDNVIVNVNSKFKNTTYYKY